MKDKKPICGICGAKLPECGSFVQCKVFPTGYACTSCCCNCMHHGSAGSVVWCSAAYKEKEK